MAKINARPNIKKNPNNDKMGRILLLLVGLCVIAYGIWFLNTHSLVSTGVRYTPIDKAGENPYFASTLLLESENKTATYLKREQADGELKAIWQDKTTAKDKTLILERLGDAQKSNLDAIIDWVKAGGHLVVFSQDTYYQEMSDDDDFKEYQDNENPLLVKLGIYDISKDEEYKDDTPSDDWSVNRYQKPLKLGNKIAVVMERQIGALVYDDFLKNYNAEPYDHRAVYQGISEQEFNRNFAELTDSQKATLKKLATDNPTNFLPETAMLDAKLGQGRLTVLDMPYDSFVNPYVNYYGTGEKDDSVRLSRLAKLLGGSYFPNQNQTYYDNIRANDNAFLLSYLTANRKQVYFVPPFEHQSLWAMMKKNLPFMLFAIGAICVLSLMALPRRFGRVQTILDDSEKNSLAYYEAIGQYLWDSDNCEAQVSANRERLLEKIYARTPIIHGITDPEKLSLLIAKDSRLPAEVVYEALYGDWGNEREFVMMSRAFARLAKVYL